MAAVEKQENLDAQACTTSINLGLQQCETVLRHLTPNTEHLGRCSEAPSPTRYTATLRATDAEGQVSTSFTTGAVRVETSCPMCRSLERALLAPIGSAPASEMSREAGESELSPLFEEERVFPEGADCT